MNICEECESPIAGKTIVLRRWNMTADGLESESLEFCSPDCKNEWKEKEYHNQISIST
jgi:hypothetical protein